MSLTLEEYRGLIFRRLREGRQLTLRKLGDAIGETSSMLSRFERGGVKEPSSFRVERKLERYYGLPNGLLMIGEVKEVQPELFKAEEPEKEARPVLPTVNVEKSDDILLVMSQLADMLFKAYEAAK